VLSTVDDERIIQRSLSRDMAVLGAAQVFEHNGLALGCAPSELNFTTQFQQIRVAPTLQHALGVIVSLLSKYQIRQSGVYSQSALMHTLGPVVEVAQRHRGHRPHFHTVLCYRTKLLHCMV
jgi:hypothetical protein